MSRNVWRRDPCCRSHPSRARSQDFRLKTQTSHDIEGGFRIKSGAFQMQSSIYNMDLENEIHFIPALFYNVNLDPTRRYGSETSASLRVSDSVLLRGGLAYIRAVFREGPFAGNDVPLVSRYTASGGVTWNIWQNYLVLDATVRAWSERFMDNDQANTQRRIPAGRHGRFEAERRIRALLLVGQREQHAQCAVLRLRHGELVHAGPLRGLSAARPNLHGEGRRDVLIARAGSAPCRTGLYLTAAAIDLSGGKLPIPIRSGASARSAPSRSDRDDPVRLFSRTIPFRR